MMPASARRTRCIVGVAELLDVRRLTRADGRAALCPCEGRIGLFLANVRRLARPIPCPGALSMWTVPPAIEAAIMQQLPETLSA